MKRLVAIAMVALCAAAQAVTITVRNFDADLATVYVNDVPTTNGQVVVIDGETAKIELKDFRNDYYFRFAPETQTDKQLAFASWEAGSGLVPADYAEQNPATFTVTEDLTITPNVNVKGYKWTADSSCATMENQWLQWNVKSHNDTMRTVTLGSCIANTAGTTTPSLPLDCVQRVEFNGKNYTIVALNTGLSNSYIDRIVLPHRFTTFGDNVSSGSNFKILELVGLAEASVTSVGITAFYYSAFNGFVGNFVPTNVQTLGTSAYHGLSGMTGELCLTAIKSLGGNAFKNCTGLTSIRIVSPGLTSISAFDGCTGLADVTIDASRLAGAGAFPSSVQRIVFIGAAPAHSVVGNMVSAQPSADGAHQLTMQVNPTETSWWALTAPPTENEIAAGLPEGCLGVFATDTGFRKAWVVADGDALGGTLLETDMTRQEGNAGYVTHGGLARDDELALTAPEGMTKCDLQHLMDGVWTTFDTKTGGSFTYKHDGQLTRAVWGVDGVILNVTTNGYSGGVSVELKSGSEVSPGIYSPGSVVWLSAAGSDAHPRSVFDKWTGGVPEGMESDAVLKLTLDVDTTVKAEFRPTEWLYNPTAKTIWDGEYTSTARIGDIVDRGMTFKDFKSGDYSLWLDFSLPIYNPDDPDNAYWITKLTTDGNTTWRRVRFGERIISMTGMMFVRSGALMEVEGLARTKITSMPQQFIYGAGAVPPISTLTYEAEDFVPETLRTIGVYAFASGPNLVGTLRLNVKTIGDLGRLRFNSVTNFEFLAEDVTTVPSFYNVSNPNSFTFASTNLVSSERAFNGNLKNLVFLAHAPTRTALDNMLWFPASGKTVIHADRHAPGWKALHAGFQPGERKAGPAGTWGVYQTASGKRFYIVQQDSPYGVKPGLLLRVE